MFGTYDGRTIAQHPRPPGSIFVEIRIHAFLSSFLFDRNFFNTFHHTIYLLPTTSYSARGVREDDSAWTLAPL